MKIKEFYFGTEEKIRKKVKNGEKIKVTFFVSITSMFPARSLFEHMLKDNRFLVTLLIIPDYRFDVEENIRKTVSELSEFKSVMMVSPSERDTDTINIKEIADIVFPAVPYNISHKKYNLFELMIKGVLPSLINYGFFRSYYDRYSLIKTELNSCYWKIFIETKYNQLEYKKYQIIKGENTVLTGYSKMDGYFDEFKKNVFGNKKKKTILIAPHHSVDGGHNPILSLSNFQRYSEFFLKLPDMYPNVDFIFRPHPALFHLLSGESFWGAEKVENYISKIKNKPNVVYSDTGDYFKDFAISDAMIDDCGSFLVEYFYTKKPQCYMLKEKADIDNKFTPLGKKCLEKCYIAYDESQIINFIENVVIKGKDKKKFSREKFATEKIMLNYPNASKKIADYIAKYFGLDY